jgi:3-hydroxybutyrate dehydrogenase
MTTGLEENTKRMGKLDGQVAVVTGAAAGIGRAIADLFATEGATVAIADLSITAARVAAAEIMAQGGQATAIAMDVSDEEAVEAGIANVLAACGRVDILVSNAGIQIVHPLHEFPLPDWRRMLAIHLDGAFLVARACLRPMYAAKRGAIIYIGSVHSKEASALKAAYVTAKHGLIGLARVVAKKGAAHGVRANTVCPGFVRTALVEKQIPEQARALGLSEEQVVRDVMLKDTVDGEFTAADDVARAVLFFAAAESGAMTGQSLIVSHGWCME